MNRMMMILPRVCFALVAGNVLQACVLPSDEGPDAGAPISPEPSVGADEQGGGVAACGVTDELDPPVDAALYIPGSYRGRCFLCDGVHLGEDIALPEGAPVRASGNGRVLYYGPASGYGELLVAIEYDLGRVVRFTNGADGFTETRFVISISGHLRLSRVRGSAPTGLRAGDCVTAGTIVGFVNDDAHNGDGAEHLHEGIRLMSGARAVERDGRYAYRGYDSSGRFRGDFAAASAVFGLEFPEPAPPEAEEEPAAQEECNPEQYLRCGMSACERIVRSCVDGVPQVCVPGTPEPEICGDWVDNDCNGPIDDGCEEPRREPPPEDPPEDEPAPCGATIEVIWENGAAGWVFLSDLYSDRHWGREMGVPSFRQTFTCVPAGTHRLNAEFIGPRWGCEEWPENILTTPYGLPRLYINGREVSVTPAEEPGLDLGCNLFVTVE